MKYVASTLVLILMVSTSAARADEGDREARRRQVKRRGGSLATEQAVMAGLRWLARHQGPDGSWSSSEFDKNCASKSSRCSGYGFTYWDAGVSGLALLAFQGAGHTQDQGEFQSVVRKGLGWLRKNQQEEGKLEGAIGYVEEEKGTPKEEWVYNHAIATMALCEAYASSGEDSSLRVSAQRAVDLCLRAQNPGWGWRYGIRTDDNDTSVTGWMVQALRAGKEAGLDVPEDRFEGALASIAEATNKKGHTGYRKPNGASSFLPMQRGKYKQIPCMTAVGMLTRLVCGQKRTEKILRKGRSILRKSLPAWSSDKMSTVNMYYWYYGTYVMFRVRGNYWKEWNKAMQEALLPSQQQEGGAAGSWDPIGEWGIAGGRVYSTAIGVLTLEVYYRHARN
ncbi:MAG: terpene cyclase/mutase family protein [Planctomycetota bacterium]|nr:terpene cyclase/mutase family protein [Planctomycetota bacterium]